MKTKKRGTLPIEFTIEYRTCSNDIDSLTYRLLDNEVVSAWLDCLQNAKPCLNWSTYGLQDFDILELASQLELSYNNISKKLLEKDQNINTSSIVSGGKIDQKVLNELHAVFHYYKERETEYQLSDRASQQYLQVINKNVHSLESMINGTKTSFQIIINPVRYYQGFEIPYNWYKRFFNQPVNHGDLVLGYATVGKELLEIYNSNDVSNLDCISPQRYVSGEFRQNFSSCINIDTVDKIKEWCLDNGKTDLSDAELYTFRPKLGTIKTDLNYAELRLKCSQFTEVLGYEVKREPSGDVIMMASDIKNDIDQNIKIDKNQNIKKDTSQNKTRNVNTQMYKRNYLKVYGKPESSPKVHLFGRLNFKPPYGETLLAYLNQGNNLEKIKKVGALYVLPEEGELQPNFNNDLIESLPIEFIFCSYGENEKSNLKVIRWPNYFLYDFFVRRRSLIVDTNPEDIKYLFTLLNGRVRSHRVFLMDQLEKYDLLSENKFTWHSKYDSKMVFKFWNPQVTKLDGDHFQKSQYGYPNEMYQSLLELVSETSIDVPFISEKTYRPIVLKKPFIISGMRGVHKYLESLGYQLHRNIIDYSFDDEENWHLRTEMLVKELKRLSSLDFKKLHQDMKPVIEHNHNLAKQQVIDKVGIPDIIFNFSRYNKKINVAIENAKSGKHNPWNGYL